MTDLPIFRQSIGSKEPVAIINAIIAVIEAGITLLVAFGLDLTPEQIVAVMAFVIAAATLIQTVWARSLVSPVAPGPEG